MRAVDSMFAGVWVCVRVCVCVLVCVVWSLSCEILFQFSFVWNSLFAEDVASLRRLLIHHARTMGTRWEAKGGIMACNLIDFAPILAFSFF